MEIENITEDAQIEGVKAELETLLGGLEGGRKSKGDFDDGRRWEIEVVRGQNAQNNIRVAIIAADDLSRDAISIAFTRGGMCLIGSKNDVTGLEQLYAMLAEIKGALSTPIASRQQPAITGTRRDLKKALK